jgi:hypothetical protein
LTPPPLRRTLDFTMPATFEAAFGRVKQLVADFRANEKFYLFPVRRCDGLPRDGVLCSLDRQIDALVYDLYTPTSAEMIIVEGAAK